MRMHQLKMIGLFAALCLFFSAWMTGFDFSFAECRLFPNYNMLAASFAEGRLSIEAPPKTVDILVKDGRQYLYAGPVPALLRLPLMPVLEKGIPSGVMIVLFCAGIGTLFIILLGQLTPADQPGAGSFLRASLVLVFVLNGFTLLMVTIPSFHHEAISAAMFFLMAALYYFFKIRRSGYRPTSGETIGIALALSLCVGSRVSYAVAAAALGAMVVVGIIRNPAQVPRREIIRSLGILAGVAGLSIGLLMWYNHARFGSVLDFGTHYQASFYRDYLIRKGYLRYDHFPYNFWSYFFRIPRVSTQFPFLLLPAYFLKVQSLGPMPYLLVNGNELAVSLFCLMPVTVLIFITLGQPGFRSEAKSNGLFNLALVCVLQVAVISLSLAATARYYYDFLPLLLLMASFGAIWLQKQGKAGAGLLLFLNAVSILISFALPMNAIRFYQTYIDYPSPLLRIFF